jgi:hypothetical protein
MGWIPLTESTAGHLEFLRADMRRALTDLIQTRQPAHGEFFGLTGTAIFSVALLTGEGRSSRISSSATSPA